MQCCVVNIQNTIPYIIPPRRLHFTRHSESAINCERFAVLGNSKRNEYCILVMNTCTRNNWDLQSSETVVERSVVWGEELVVERSVVWGEELVVERSVVGGRS